MKINQLSIVRTRVDGYPWQPPFDPGEAYPECPFKTVAYATNEVYAMVRQALWDLGYDSDRQGTPDWNPFGHFVQPGQTVVIKPNFVLDYNQEHYGREAKAAVVTDGSVLRPIIDYAFKAVGPTGKVLICETPLQNEVSPWLIDTVASDNGTRATIQELRARGVPLELHDLRNRVRRTNRFGFWQVTHKTGDPCGYVEFDLGKQSAFEGVPAGRLRTNDWEDVSKYHAGGRHIYSVSKTILSADFIVNVPKLKVHKKTGLTVAVKNMFALSNRKDCIPHWQHRVDDNPTNRSWLHEFLRYCYSKPLLHAFGVHATRKLHVQLDGYGNWSGNDTTWRGVADINRILLYGDTSGQLHNRQQRPILCIVDGVIAGERLGPLGPKPKLFGAIVAGEDAVEVDIACAQLMRMDPRAVKLLAHQIDAPAPRLTRCTSKDFEPNPSILQFSEQFELPVGWEGTRLQVPAAAAAASFPGTDTLEPKAHLKFGSNPY
jgi:uncharacterized protein (DUF362 family)